MNKDTAIQINGISKEYKLYSGKAQMLKDWSKLYAIQFWKKPPEFPIKKALDNVSLTIKKGERIGIIGRNGAGKTTLLKIINNMIGPTSGTVEINGKIQSLMRAGGGMHPDISGAENARNGLLYNGLRGQELEDAYQSVLDFAELGDYIHQPVQSYSLGMASRLSFAIATAITPDILIIDEVLGAGDSYFATKSVERMKALTNSGCTLLLVSHSRGQIMEFCEKAVWIDNGSIRAVGDVEEVTAAYDKELTYEEEKEATAKKKQSANETIIYTDPPDFMALPGYQNNIKNTLNDTYGEETLAGVTQGDYLSTIDCYSNDGKSNMMSTGDDFKISLNLKENAITKDDISNYSCDLLFFDDSGILASSTSSPTLDRKKAIRQIDIDLSPCSLGHRTYNMSVVLKKDNKAVDYLTNFAIKIIDTNDSDPPLIHYPALWYFHDQKSPVEGRVSGVQ